MTDRRGIGGRTLVLGVAFGIAAVGACTSRTTDSGIPAARSGTILGGSADTTRDVVMALLQMETATTAYACSGTTIAQSGTSAFLLTAAHCVVQHDAADNARHVDPERALTSQLQPEAAPRGEGTRFFALSRLRERVGVEGKPLWIARALSLRGATPCRPPA